MYVPQTSQLLYLVDEDDFGDDMFSANLFRWYIFLLFIIVFSVLHISKQVLNIKIYISMQLKEML
jgi:hypothetical protein